MKISVKNQSRLMSISANTLRQLTISAINMGVPLLIIWISSKEIWGAFVSILLFTLVAQQVVNWGNKEYLIREFSQSPRNIPDRYSASLATRFPLVLFFAAIALIWFPAEYVGAIFLWLAGRFLTQSSETMVIFERDFNASMLIEIACIALFCALYAFWKTSLPTLLFAYSLYQFLRGIAYFVRFRRFVWTGSLRLERLFFKNALPFFLLSVLGFLVSKADVYAVGYFTSETTTGEYQIVNSVLAFAASTSAFIYAPFTKNLYRGDAQTVKKTHRLVLASGFAIIPPALVCIHYALWFYLEFCFGWIFYLLGFLYIFPHFAYGTKIIALFRAKREKKAIEILALSAACNLGTSSLLLYFGFGIPGALAGAVTAQFVNWYLLGSQSRD